MRHYPGPIEAAPTRRHDGSSEKAPIPRKQLNASSSGPSNTPRVECGDLEAERMCSSQPRPLGVHAAEARSVNVSAIEQTEQAAVGCASIAARSARLRA